MVHVYVLKMISGAKQQLPFIHRLGYSNMPQSPPLPIVSIQRKGVVITVLALLLCVAQKSSLLPMTLTKVRTQNKG